MCNEHHGEHHKDGEKRILNEEGVIKFIENEKIEWVKAKDLLSATAESCVDGRGKEGIVGTPGGNAGEFILALTAAEKTNGRELDLEQMDEILARYLEKTGKFYLHTDDHSLGDLTEKEIRNPDESQKEKLLALLSDASHIGCGHLKLMTKNPEEYGVRPELTAEAIKSIYKALWDRPEDIEFVVLKGGHKEGAVVNILVEGEINDETKIPTISPSHDGMQVFVNHPQAVNYLRDTIAEDMKEITGLNFDLDSFKKKTKELGGRQLDATVSHLAKGLPVYSVKISKDGKCEIV